MTCEYVEQLLPLYVGGDLEEERSQSVAAHLRACPRCAGVTDDYAGANQLLQRFEPPFFSAEVYAGIRRQVLKKIEQKSHAPSWSSVVSQFLSPLVQPHLRWITAALLIAMSMTAFYFIANRSNKVPTGQQAHNSSLTGERNPGDRSPSDRAPDSFSTPAAVTGKNVGNAGPVNQRSRQKVVVATQRGRTSATKVLALPNSRSAQPDVALSQPSSPAPLRMELQTGDRNIRIIWLSSQRPEAGAKETSKGI